MADKIYFKRLIQVDPAILASLLMIRGSVGICPSHFEGFDSTDPGLSSNLA